ncbi:AAA family ATPase [Streptomyces microflavus]|uniref:AAA family ATPase n=1 Tax=Streptomyces microflavus TaxID=1919 RepID=UPI0033B49AEF
MTLSSSHGPGRSGDLVYDLSDDLRLAIDVALVTDRPLLLRGDPGSGKSSLAAYYAQEKGLKYLEHVVTSRTQATDLLWTFDSVRRLADAQARGGCKPDRDYVRAGVLWQAFAPTSAPATSSGVGSPSHGNINGESDEPPLAEQKSSGAVVLIDEIDKADPDVPNGLLVPLGSQRFTVADTGAEIEREAKAGSILVIITTNGERQLPEAFLRRCVTYTLPEPTFESLVRIATLHLSGDKGTLDDATGRLAHELAAVLIEVRRRGARGRERLPSTAEYLDALRACKSLRVTPQHSDWQLVQNLTMLKTAQQKGLTDASGDLGR